MAQLAMLGGQPVWKGEFPRYVSIGAEEKAAVLEVLDSGILSNFYGSHGPEFYGGPRVQAFEREWAEYFEAPFAVTMNSATSGLYAAVGALEIGPGDEVITTPYTMSATACGILVYNAVPVFADIDADIFALDPASVEAKVTQRTRAIIVTHLFGHPADMDGILAVAKRHNLRVIEDAAQAPGALFRGRRVGTMGDIGVFSLNCHKTIQTGEGGVCVTRDPELAKRLQLIRNHAEAVIDGGIEVESMVNMLGWNYRMTEIEAAIGREQLKRLGGFNQRRADLAGRLTERLRTLPGVTPPAVRPDCSHVYYVYAVKLDPITLGVSRDLFAQALLAEGIPVACGYMRPLYTFPLYRKKILFGNKGFPFTSPLYEGKADYRDGLCPVTEAVEKRLLVMEGIRDPLTLQDMGTIADAFQKVLDQVDALKRYAATRGT
ncbi:MAG TPA: DegT/DnrJ/EryC1/StrS family aminotransferase [Candidatus Binatia bacterium]